MAGDLPGAELEPKTSFLMAPQDASLLIPQAGGLVHLDSSPFQGLAPSLLEVLPGSPLLERAKGNSGGGASRESPGLGWGWEFGAGGRPGQACPEGRIPCTHALDAGMSTEL